MEGSPQRISVQPEEISLDDSGKVLISNQPLADAVREAQSQRSGTTIPTDINVTICITGDNG